MGEPRKKDLDDAHDDKYAIKETGMKMNGRSCTDGICCFIFSLFIIAMAGICAYSMRVGDPRLILTAFDSDGNQCGYSNQNLSPGVSTVARDFTEYKYKYFTGVLDSAIGQTSKGLYNAVCVKECVDTLSSPGVASALNKPLECMINTDVTKCPAPKVNTTNFYSLCVPEFDSTKTLITQFYTGINGNGQISNYVAQVQDSTTVLIIMCFVVLVSTMVYIWLLRIIAKPILYVSMVALLVFGVLSGLWVFMKKDDYQNVEGQVGPYQYCLFGSILIWVITGLYLCFICCQYKNIQLGAAILHCSSEYLSSNNRIVFMPISTYFAILPITALWIASTVFLMSIGKPAFQENSFVAKITYEDHINYIFWVYLFGFFWIVAFIAAIQQFVIATTCCMWYFSQGGDDVSNAGGVSISLAFGWSFKYHLGSLAMGSMLIAIMTLIKVVFEYLVKKYEAITGTDGTVYKIVTCCIRCVIWSLDSYVKFINRNAYIQIALQSQSFCKSAWQAFYLAVRHAGRFNSSSLIGFIMTSMGKGLIVAFNVYLTIVLTQSMNPNVQQPWIPAIPIGILAYVVASLFLSIYDFSSLAILHCFILNEDQNGSTRPPKALEDFMDIDSKHARSGRDNKRVSSMGSNDDAGDESLTKTQQVDKPHQMF